MAEQDVKQAFLDAILDADSLERFINGSDSETVLTRLSAEYPTLQKAIKDLFENGGLPATPFATKALMTASALADGDYAQVTDDTDNNGLYVKTAGVWVKSAYDPLSSAIAHADSMINSISKTIFNKNLYDNNAKITGKFINNEGNILPVEGWSISDYIPVIEGEAYTVSSKSRRQNLAFFAGKTTESISGNYTNINDPITVVAPATAKYLVINVDSDLITSSEVQVERGTVATDYQPFGIIKNILPHDITYKDDLIKPYESTFKSKNLFDKSRIIPLQYLSSGVGGLVKSPNIMDWSTSHLIPVVAGKTYTLSGLRGRRGLSFFANDVDLSVALLYIDDTTLPLTVTAPAGANFAMFNIQAPSATTYADLQFEEGATATPYVEYAIYTGVDYKYIVGAPTEGLSPAQLSILPDNNARITASQDIRVDIDLVITKPLSFEGSTALNFTGDTVNNNLVRALNDDIAPLRVDNATIGANHGYSKVLCTLTGHGKTAADVGSVWTDGTYEWVIINIVSSNQFNITARASNRGSLASNTLTHVSGAGNTTSMTLSAKVAGQWHPAFKNRKLNVYVDGVKIDTSRVQKHNYKDSIAFHESYEIMAKTDVVEWLIANGGVERKEYDAEPSVLYNNSYVFDKDGGCVIYTSMTAYKPIPFSDYMGTQSIPFAKTSGRYYYVPKTVPFTQDSMTYDFTALQPMSSAIPTSIYFNADKNEVGENPVDRLIQFTDGVGYATGYLPLLDAEPSERVTNASNKYLEIRNSSLKIYPSLINGLKTTLAAGDTFAGVAYRKYFKRDNKRTAKYVVRSNIADFLYLDWHSAKTDTIELPDDLIGRNFTVHEKSSNVTLLSKFATNNIVVEVDNSKSYGYLALRFDK